MSRYDEFSHKTLLSLSVNLRKLKALQQITLLFESYFPSHEISESLQIDQ